MNRINPTALFFVAFFSAVAHLFGYGWVTGFAIGCGLVLLVSLR